MGRDSRDVGVTVIVHVSRHNSFQDRIDDALADELADRIRRFAQAAAREPRYEPIEPDVA